MGVELSEEQLLADLAALGIGREWLSDYDRIENYIRDTAINEKRPVTVPEVAESLGLDRNTVSKRCSELRIKGKLHKVPKRRGYYIPAGVAR